MDLIKKQIENYIIDCDKLRPKDVYVQEYLIFLEGLKTNETLQNSIKAKYENSISTEGYCDSRLSEMITIAWEEECHSPQKMVDSLKGNDAQTVIKKLNIQYYAHPALRDAELNKRQEEFREWLLTYLIEKSGMPKDLCEVLFDCINCTAVNTEAEFIAIVDKIKPQDSTLDLNSLNVRDFNGMNVRMFTFITEFCNEFMALPSSNDIITAEDDLIYNRLNSNYYDILSSEHDTRAEEFDTEMLRRLTTAGFSDVWAKALLDTVSIIGYEDDEWQGYTTKLQIDRDNSLSVTYEILYMIMTKSKKIWEITLIQ